MCCEKNQEKCQNEREAKLEECSLEQKATIPVHRTNTPAER